MSIISEMLQQRSCQANVHGKHGQLKCFQKRQNKCKCHVRLEGADLLSLYNRNLKSLFYNTGLNFWKHWHLCFKSKLFYWARSAKTCDAGQNDIVFWIWCWCKSLENCINMKFFIFFIHSRSWQTFFCLHNIYTCGMPRPISTCECLNTYYWILDYNAKSLSWIMSM